MILGYARVSTNEQNPALQTDALKSYGCERVFEEKVSAASKVRPQLERLLDSLREGDKVVVWRLDRLGRSIKDLIVLVELFKDRGVQFVSLTENIDTSSPPGELIFHIFASVAQFERSLIIERTKSGLNAARARGRVGGRKPKLSPEDVKKARALALSNDISMGEIAEHFKDFKKKKGFLAFQKIKNKKIFSDWRILSPSGDLKEAASNFFDFLHQLDEGPAEIIFAEKVKEVGLGRAIMERLNKAAHQ